MRFYFFLLLTITIIILSCNNLCFAALFLQVLYFLGNDMWWGPSWFKPVMWVTAFVILKLIGKKEFRTDLIFFLLICLAIIFYISSSKAVASTDVAKNFTLTYVKLVFGYSIFYNITRKYPDKLPVLFCWTNFLCCLYMYKSLLIGYVYTGGRVDTGVGQGGGANYVAMLYAMSLPFVFIKIETAKKNSVKLFFQCSFLLFCSALAITGSRAGFLAFVIPLLWLLNYLNTAKKLKYGMLCLSISAVLTVVIPSFTNRIETIDNYQQGSAGERLLLWKTALEIAEKNWLVGIGPNNFHLISHRLIPVKSNVKFNGETVGLHVHNTYLQLWAEAGFLALIIFLTVLIISWRRYRAVILSNTKNMDENIVVLSLFGGIIAYSICAFFGSIIYRDVIYWYFAVLSAVWSNQREVK